MPSRAGVPPTYGLNPPGDTVMVIHIHWGLPARQPTIMMLSTGTCEVVNRKFV